LRVATYARYSSDKQREASIEDQLRNCDAYCQRHGWRVVSRFKDEALSGAKSDRPGYQAMLAAATAHKFDVLVLDDLSRLSRDQIEMTLVMRRFCYLGIRIIGVSDGCDSNSENYKMHAGFSSLMNELYLDDLRKKTHRGLTGQALKGNSCGGNVYGYRRVAIEDANHRDEYGRPAIISVRREVAPEQAAVVRQIFELYADGHAPRRIAAELNRQGVPSPRGGTWAATAIYGDMTKGTGLLNNELYIGRYIWNRSKWVPNPDTGRRNRKLRPEEDWIVKELPELRIIDQALWDRVKHRQHLQAVQSEQIRKALHHQARTGAGPKYLFSGLLRCATCGANYVVSDKYRYACSTHINRGEAACDNAIKVSRKVVETRLLESIKRDLFTPEAFQLFEAETSRLLKEHRAAEAPIKNRVQDRLKAVETEIANIMAAIKAGIFTPATKDELEHCERERDDLRRKLADTAEQAPVIVEALPDALARFHALVENLEQSVAKDIPRARTQIQALVGGEIRLHPTEENYLEAELAGDYAGLISLIKERPGGEAGASKLRVVAGARNQRYLQLSEAWL
jgi:DNA invertase Pin-like site-specific DNA recombinase